MIWLVLLAFSFTCGEEIPKIIIDAGDYYGFPDNFKILGVTTNNVDGASYYWMRDGTKITKDTTPGFSNYDQRILMLLNAPSIDYAGVYQFVMTAPASGTIKGRKATVKFTYLGSFDPNLPTDYKPDVIVGQANYIKCPKHTAGSNVIYKWGKSSEISGTKFMESKPNHIVLDNGTLFYSHLTEDDLTVFNQNSWTCGMEGKVGDDSKFRWAENIKTQLNKVGTNMTKFGPQIVTTLPKDKRFQEGDTITMKCAAAGRPTPVYTWRRIDVYGKEHAVRNGLDGIKFDDGDSRLLVIKSAERNHAGQYFCTATIGNKNDTVEGFLSFEVEPKWIGQSIDHAMPSIYANHSWTCNATGFPIPTYKWYKDGNQLSDTATCKITGGTITFTNLARADTGMYQCVADNGLNNIHQYAYMDVQATKPVFDSNTGTTTLFLEARGVIKCQAKAAPKAKNTWRKDGVDIDFSLSRYTLVNNEDLAIDGVLKPDTGNYTCNAKNEFGTDSKKISVQVVGEITFIAKPENKNTTRGSQTHLKCEAEGDKGPNKATIKYKWKYNGKYIPLNDTIVWSEEAHNLYFLNPQVSQSGIYECIAYIDQPSYAEKKSHAKVVIRGPPEAPNQVKIDGDCSGFSAKLQWHITGSNYEPIKYFIIQMESSYETVWRNISDHVDPNQDEKTISNLSPWTRYRFRVLAINKIGTSAPSYPTLFENCETPQAAPTICPKIWAIPGKENELTLKWEEIKLIDQNGANYTYTLEYSSSDPTFSDTKTFEPYVLEFMVPNAGYYKPWTFKIQGNNSIGRGPFCHGKSFSGQNAPTIAPTDLFATEVGVTFMVLTWTPISLKKGSVDGYKLKYYQVLSTRSRRSISANECDKNNPCHVDISGGGTNSIRLDGLKTFTRYRVEIQGYNSGGNGPVSSIQVTTSQDKPGKMDNVTVTPYAKFMKLVWGEPSRPNGEITGYNVSIDMDANPRFAVLRGAARKYVFAGLRPNTKYVMSIQAETKAGFGEKQLLTATTKDLQAPAKPGVPILVGFGENGVNVTFQEGKPEKGFPEKFIVLYRVKGGDGKWKQTKPVDVLFGPNGERRSKPYVEIYDLDKNVKYEMATIAVNEEGRSVESDIQIVQPGEGIAPKARNDNPVYKRSWFVAIVVIVCFLLIILLIALVVTRKRGERYPVGKREKKRAGILDIGEEPDFNNAYPMKQGRQNGNGVNRQNSGGSLPNKDPDRDSLDEYGEDRFDEDAASLIGVYNDDRRPNKTVEEPEFV